MPLNVTGQQETGDGVKIHWGQQQEFYMDTQPSVRQIAEQS